MCEKGRKRQDVTCSQYISVLIQNRFVTFYSVSYFKILKKPGQGLRNKIHILNFVKTIKSHYCRLRGPSRQTLCANFTCTCKYVSQVLIVNNELKVWNGSKERIDLAPWASNVMLELIGKIKVKFDSRIEPGESRRSLTRSKNILTTDFGKTPTKVYSALLDKTLKNKLLISNTQISSAALSAFSLAFLDLGIQILCQNKKDQKLNWT